MTYPRTKARITVRDGPGMDLFFLFVVTCAGHLLTIAVAMIWRGGSRTVACHHGSKTMPLA